VKEPGDKNESNDIVPSRGGNLAKVASELVRRGLHDLSNEVKKERPRVLVVDDESAIVEVVEQLLLAHGYDVRSTCNASEAIELAREFQPRVALLGVVMPEIGGVQLGVELSTFLTQTRIVLSMEDVSETDLNDLRSCGYQFDTLPAPFEIEQLLEKMWYWVQESTALDLITGFGLKANFNRVVEAEMYRSQRYGYEFFILMFVVSEHWDGNQSRVPIGERRNVLGKFIQRIGPLRIIDFGFRLWDTGSANCFAILFPQTSRVFADRVAHRLRALINETDWKSLTGSPVRLTIDQFQVTSFPEDREQMARIIPIPF
jgi:CheY-like chemotaxis protein